MNKHGLSHALSVLVCTVASSLLIDIIREYVPLINRILSYLSAEIIRLLGVRFPVQSLSMLILAAILAMIWGMAFAKLKDS